MPIQFESWFLSETPKVVAVKSVPLGILRLALNISLVIFVFVYELWYARGYQNFIQVHSSTTVKVKGLST